MTDRERLPNRRVSELVDFEHGGRRNLENIAAGELARWIKLTTPNSRRHVIRLLQDCADILERELKGIADGPSKANGAGETA